MAQSLLHQCFALLASYQPKGSKRECKSDPSVQGFEQLDIQLSQLLNSYLQIVDSPRPGDPILALCRRWSEFTQSIDNKGEEFFATYTVDSRGITLKITCCDASQHLAACTKEFEHVVAFSATLKPFDYYARLCGFDDQHLQTVEFQSPFPADNRKLLVIPQVSTKYADRSRNYGKIAQAIEKIVGVRKGNYFVFFPSFAFLRDVFERTNLPEFDVLQQKPNMTNADVQKFIEKMRSGSQSTVIFAVQGGVFSEGVDYPGDMLIGAIIVGPSLPGYDLQRELMREYYEKRFGQGFDYAYTYPAMARVVQAAGRVIRSESDRGLIVLMDRRFTAPAYTATMPADWFQRSVNELVSHSILTDISNFWNGAAHAAV
jgi:DNA excision repair protein ERCC-2